MTILDTSTGRIDVDAVKKDFAVLSRTVRNESPLIYLDSAATSQKPRQVLDAERHFYETANAAVHRGAHQLAEEATDAYEGARATIAAFIGADAEDVIFTRNATESLNLMAYAFSNATAKAAFGSPLPEGAERFVLKPGDEIVVTEMEHHANLIPWQEVCAKTGAVLRWIPITDDGRLDLEKMGSVVNDRTRVISFTHQSNLLGTINDVAAVAAAGRAVGALVILDACQSIPHMAFDVSSMDVDAVAWSGHKMLGPTGIGCLWVRPEVAASMPPFNTGGSMIETVTMEASTFAPSPKRFEAGVPMVAQAVGLGEACHYLNDIGMDAVQNHEVSLTSKAIEGLQAIRGVEIIGPANLIDRGGAVSFVMSGVHPHDLGQLLDDRGVAVRVGHHCAWPTCRRLGVPATTRLSSYLYNDQHDIDVFLSAVDEAREFFGVS